MQQNSVYHCQAVGQSVELLLKVALIVKQVEEADWALDNQVQTALVVLELDLGPVDALAIVVLPML